MKTKAKTKIITAKFGLDGHNNGVAIVNQWLREAGFDVIDMGLYNTAESVIDAAIEKKVDLIGCSFLEGSQLFYVQKLVDLAKERKLDNIKFVVGGVIPANDVVKLKKMGVKEVYTPATQKEVIIEGIKALA